MHLNLLEINSYHLLQNLRVRRERKNCSFRERVALKNITKHCNQYRKKRRVVKIRAKMNSRVAQMNAFRRKVLQIQTNRYKNVIKSKLKT